jgi:exopolyphosphatase/guanosine-5'-triphosphate,3'-diphosphate pyrophosphatase
MDIERYAGIDIGSNAARLIIKDIHPLDNNKFFLKKRVYIRLPLRLGTDVFSSGIVSNEKIAEFEKAMKIFREIMDYNNITKYRACATSALRNALNSADIITNIKNFAQIDIEIIDGYEEAHLLYITVREFLKRKKIYVSADLGGGSLQLGIYKYNEFIWGHAFETGTLRFLTNTVKREEIRKLIKKVSEIKNEYPNAQLVGSGGNINKISKLLRKKNVSYKDLILLYKKLSIISYSDRIEKYGLREDRADVIIPALKMYIKTLKFSDSDYIIVPKTGLADGIIQKLFNDDFGCEKLKFRLPSILS